MDGDGRSKTYIHIHTYIHSYIHTYIHIVSIHLLPIYLCVHVCFYICMYVWVYVWVHAYLHTCVHTYIHTYVHTYIHTFFLGNARQRGGGDRCTTRDQPGALEGMYIYVPKYLCNYVYMYLSVNHMNIPPLSFL